MAAKPVNGSGNGARSGAQTLVLLAVPLNILILDALADGTKQQAELRRIAGSPAQTTLRAQLKRLTEIGAIEKHRRNRFPGILEYELSAAGRDLLPVMATLRLWLDKSPDGPLELGGGQAKAAVKALADGWSTTMVRALAAQSLSLTELDRVIVKFNYPSLERRLSAMRLANHVTAGRGDSHRTPYTVTTWLRQGVAPLTAAARWERRHLPRETTPFGRLDIEATFMLAAPLLRLSEDLSGSCWLATETPNKESPSLAGAMLNVESRRVASCVTEIRGNPDAWALGPTSAWFDAMIDLDIGQLELGGDCRLATALLEGLHRALFGVPVTPNNS